MAPQMEGPAPRAPKTSGVRGRRSEQDLAQLRERIETLMVSGLTAPAIHRALTGSENPSPIALSERAVRGHIRAIERSWAKRAGAEALAADRARGIAEVEEMRRTALRRSALNANSNVGVGWANVYLKSTDQWITLRGLAAPGRTEISGPGGAPLALVLGDHPADHHSPDEQIKRTRLLLADLEAEATPAAETTTDPEGDRP